MKKQNATQQQSQAIAYHALEKHSGRNASRETITEGSSYDVDLVVSGKVNKTKVKFPICGSLKVGHSTQSSRGPNMKALLAFALDLLSKPKRETFLATVTRESDGCEETVAAVAALNKRLGVQSDRAGSIHFVENVQT